MILSYSKKFIALKSYEVKDELKEAGFSWNPKDKVWETKNYFAASQFKNYADPEALRVLNEQAKEYDRVFSLGQKTDSDIVIPCNTGLSYFKHQKVAIEFVNSLPNSLLSCDLGTGKTIMASGVINYCDYTKVLIVCPNTLKLNWKKELEKWLVVPRDISVIYPTKFKVGEITIVNYDLLEKYKKELQQEWELLICDESSFLKSEKTARYKALSYAAKYAKKKVFLSGTPILNKPKELWTSINELAPGLMTKSAFEKRYCGGYLDEIWKKQYDPELGRVVPKPIKIWKADGATNLEELSNLLRRTIMYRCRLKDVVDMPDKIRQVIYLNSLQDIVEQERQDYEQLKRDYDEGKIESISLFLSEVSKVRHRTALAKVPQTIEFVKDILEQGEKVVLFAHHRDVVESYYKELGGLKITGETPSDERQEIVDRFQTDPEVHVITLSIHAASMGITLTASHIVVFAELDWTPAIMNQAECRTYRIGQENKVLVYYLVVEGSIDGNMVTKLIQKQEIIDKAIDEFDVSINEQELLDILEEK